MFGRLYKLTTIFKHPIVYGKQLKHELYYDYLALTGQLQYKHNLIFIAGLPKSGTSWLEKLVSEIPGYIQMNGSFLRRLHGHGRLAYSHGINWDVINSAPKNRFSFLKLHTHYEEQYMQVLNNAGIKATILIRDIRDMMISRYYHVMADQNHWQHEIIKSLPFEEGFEKSLFGKSYEDTMDVIYFYTKWILDWIRYIGANEDKCFLMSYEDMKNNLLSIFKKFLYFYQFEFSDKFISHMIKAQNKMHLNKNNLSENLNLIGRMQTTFRKGSVGEWATLFNNKHKEIFKEIAGPMLIESGYEKNYDW